MGNSKSKDKSKDKSNTQQQQQHQQPHASSSSAVSSSSSGPDIREPLNLDPNPVNGGVEEMISDVPSPTAPEYTPEPDQAKVVESAEEAVSFWSRDKTFRPQRIVPESAAGGKGALLLKTVNATMKATLGVRDLETAVKCPPGEDLNEW